MAPSNNDENRPSNGQHAPTQRNDARPKQPEDNPFIAFRRYADEHISSLLQSITGLPSIIFPPSSRDWLIFNDEELSQLMRNWRRAADEDLNKSNNRDSHGSNRFTDLGNNENREDRSIQGHADPWGLRAHRYSSHAFPCSVFDAVFDSHLPFAPSPFFSETSPLRNPFFFDIMSPAISAGWPMSYILLSPYSPLHLERQQHQPSRKACDHGLVFWASSLLPTHPDDHTTEPHWRDAFEDLLRIENGKEMLDRSAMVQNKEESGKDWLAGMIKRGSLGASWKHVRGEGGRPDYFKYSYEDRSSSTKVLQPDLEQRDEENGGNDKGFIELDLYDEFLHDVSHDDDRTRQSPLLSIIVEMRERQRKELEELRRLWEDTDRTDGMGNMKELYDTETELDHYERQFSGTSQTPPTNLETESNSSTIVSTVTTTERRMLPDGTVKTKTVINKRFADGREESVETEEISNRDQSYQKHPDASKGSDTGNTSNTEANTPSDKHKRSGWFWRD
ncbi:uncharacterized protein CIMG_06523 [Coccidioides immitis RS]|uniref:Uncharacterized protein n=2 Tax=Coccidioides immitis TaxID=5501 RepID=J3K8B4_COCIM|nr:uncharacterized protein CIMG_06523 [Coccidioides immitis RS]EAS31044.3 hypothetical protein CIMG_06523 [Coccidioides immitis RS]TPX23903.1 hypothetical protein DIZ76_013246 [Coccidioides immitis]